jgi:hypothetical protein
MSQDAVLGKSPCLLPAGALMLELPAESIAVEKQGRQGGVVEERNSSTTMLEDGFSRKKLELTAGTSPLSLLPGCCPNPIQHSPWALPHLYPMCVHTYPPPLNPCTPEGPSPTSLSSTSNHTKLQAHLGLPPCGRQRSLNSCPRASSVSLPGPEVWHFQKMLPLLFTSYGCQQSFFKLVLLKYKSHTMKFVHLAQIYAAVQPAP